MDGQKGGDSFLLLSGEVASLGRAREASSPVNKEKRNARVGGKRVLEPESVVSGENVPSYHVPCLYTV